jgi:predicted ester cyclase
MNHAVRTQILNATTTLFRDGQVEAISQYFAPDYVVHVTDQDVRGGTSLVRSVVDLYRGAFPDLGVDVQFFLESSDTVSWQRTMRATHTGPFKGFPGTGLPIIWREMVVSRICGTLIAEEWVVTELAERLLFARKSLPRKSPAPKRPRSDA